MINNLKHGIEIRGVWCMEDKKLCTSQKIGNTIYYVKATTKIGAVHDFKLVIDRLIKKEVQKQNI